MCLVQAALEKKGRYMYLWAKRMIESGEKALYYSNFNEQFGIAYKSSVPYAHMFAAAAWMYRKTSSALYSTDASGYAQRGRYAQPDRHTSATQVADS